MKQFDSLSAVMPEGQQQLIPSPLQQLHFQSPKSPSVFLVFESQTIARQTHISTGEVTKKMRMFTVCSHGNVCILIHVPFFAQISHIVICLKRTNPIGDQVKPSLIHTVLFQQVESSSQSSFQSFLKRSKVYIKML